MLVPQACMVRQALAAALAAINLGFLHRQRPAETPYVYLCMALCLRCIMAPPPIHVRACYTRSPFQAQALGVKHWR
jgi:hypothetical protein